MAGRKTAMSTISDELRRFSDSIDGYAKAKVDRFDDDLGCISYLNSDGITKGAFTTKWFRTIADRIDAEMAELPRGKDGKPIKPGQTVYKAVNGDDGEYVIHSLRYSVPRWVVLIKRADKDASCIVRPDVLTHERPDSWERIADELEEWSEDNRINGDSEVFDRAAEFSERIRRLASREDGR